MDSAKSMGKFAVLAVLTFIFVMNRIKKENGFVDGGDVLISAFLSLFITGFVYLAFWSFS